jgi:glycerophosphoryl diester phosphodiesterase
LLGTFPGLRFTIDLKDNGNPGPLARVLRRTRAWDRVCIASLSAQRLLAAQRSLDRPVCLAVTPVVFAAVRYGGLAGTSFAARLARSGALCAQVPRRIATREFIRRAHALGLQVHVWTLNTRWEIEQALDRGADGVMTDDVVLLRDILVERGAWHPRADDCGLPGGGQTAVLPGGTPPGPLPPDARPMAESAILSAARRELPPGQGAVGKVADLTA